MLKRRQAVGKSLSDLIGLRFEPQISRSRDERVTLDQLAGEQSGNLILFMVLILSASGLNAYITRWLGKTSEWRLFKTGVCFIVFLSF